MKIMRSVKIITWLSVLVFGGASMWSYFYETKYPLPGLVKFAEEPKLYSVTAALIILLMAVFLSAKPLHTKDRILVLKGITFALWLVSVLTFSVPFGMVMWVVCMGCMHAARDV